jgi:carboxypeptidase Q
MNRLRQPALRPVGLVLAALLTSTAGAASPGNDPAALAKIRDTAMRATTPGSAWRT